MFFLLSCWMTTSGTLIWTFTIPIAAVIFVSIFLDMHTEWPCDRRLAGTGNKVFNFSQRLKTLINIISSFLQRYRYQR